MYVMIRDLLDLVYDVQVALVSRLPYVASCKDAWVSWVCERVERHASSRGWSPEKRLEMGHRLVSAHVFFGTLVPLAVLLFVPLTLRALAVTSVAVVLIVASWYLVGSCPATALESCLAGRMSQPQSRDRSQFVEFYASLWSVTYEQMQALGCLGAGAFAAAVLAWRVSQERPELVRSTLAFVSKRLLFFDET